jgi:hypothetical protein
MGTGNPNGYLVLRRKQNRRSCHMLYNALKVIGQLPEGDSGKTLPDFSDADDIAPWAIEAMKLLVETGMVSGSNGRLFPGETTTRAQMAQILYSLLSK